MPNHVSNDLTICATKATIQEIVELMRGETAFDFNRIVPMPEPLRNVEIGFITVDGKEACVWRITDDGKNVAIPQDELDGWREKYGATNWCDWARNNWGTQWNAYEIGGNISDPHIRADGTEAFYTFTTAWAPPVPVLQALADKFHAAMRLAVYGEVAEAFTVDIRPDEPPEERPSNMPTADIGRRRAALKVIK